MKALLILVLTVLLATAAACGSVARVFDGSGTVFVVEVQTDEADLASVVERTIKFIESKINAIGLDGEVKRHAEMPMRLEVNIYGNNDLERLRRFLFTTYRLELKAVISPPSPSPVRSFEQKAEAESAAKGEQVLPYFETYGSDLRYLVVKRDPIVTGEHVRDAMAVSRTGLEGDYQISFSLNKEGSEVFGEWTGRNINNYLAVVVNGEVQSTAFIRSQIFDQGEITGRFSKTKAEEIALSLRSGYIPATLKVIEERPIK